MSRSRAILAGILLLAGGSNGLAASQKEIDAAIQLGAAYLKDLYKRATPRKLMAGADGIGPAALAGLALLESGTPSTDPAVQAITAGVREASYSATQTYQLSLCLLYLDRLNDISDTPLIQMLAVRLLAGQSANGGWGYECIEAVSPLEERSLRTSLASAVPGNRPVSKPAAMPTVGQLHAEVQRYQGRLAGVRARGRIDDNSNTQFGVLGLWVARKHGVPVDAALDLIEKRFLSTQTSGGGWPYTGNAPGTPSMTCAGLLGLATSLGRSEEASKTNDLVPKGKIAPGRAADARDAAVKKSMDSLGAVLRGRGGKGLLDERGVPGNRDFYFLWSLERVGVLYGLDRIGGMDWYDLGAEDLVEAQHLSGSWGRAGRGGGVDTAFAILFLVRSNPVKDLSNRLQKDSVMAELRTGGGPPARTAPPENPTPDAAASSRTPRYTVIRPNTPGREPRPLPSPGIEPTPAPEAKLTRTELKALPPTDDPRALATEFERRTGKDWDELLEQTRDARGNPYTDALVLAAHRLEGDRLKAVRGALSERLTRMTAPTLRTMAGSADAELRRGAVLAMGMKNDPAFVPDLIAAILDEEEIVVRAARAGLKSLSKEDFGPEPGAGRDDRKAAAKAWLEWYKKQK
jgi:hypothetical protein